MQYELLTSAVRIFSEKSEYSVYLPYDIFKRYPKVQPDDDYDGYSTSYVLRFSNEKGDALSIDIPLNIKEADVMLKEIYSREL